jgi:hypothetical protein
MKEWRNREWHAAAQTNMNEMSERNKAISVELWRGGIVMSMQNRVLIRSVRLYPYSVAIRGPKGATPVASMSRNALCSTAVGADGGLETTTLHNGQTLRELTYT